MLDSLAFTEELEEVAMQLSSLNPLTDDAAEIKAIAAQTVDEYQRLAMSAAMYELEGIQLTAEWIATMLVDFQNSLPEATLELLQQGQLFSWIELAAIALQEPDDPSHLASLSTTLMDEAWPEPIAPATLEKLLVSLRMAGIPSAAAVEDDTDTTPSVTPDSAAQDETADDANRLAWNVDIHPELLDAYLQETPGQIAEVAQLLHVIAKGKSSAEQRRHAARLAHTVKGASGVVGVSAIASFTHRLEDILELNISRFLTQGLGEVLEASADCLESMFEALQEQQGLPEEYFLLLSAMNEWEQRLQSEDLNDDEETTAPLHTPEPLKLENLPDFITQGTEENHIPQDNIETQQVAATLRSGSTHLSVPIETVQTLLNLAGELITSTSQIADNVQHTLNFGKQMKHQDETVRHRLDELDENINQQSNKLQQKPTLRQTNKVFADLDQLELEAYNDLYSVAGLLTESVADNREISNNLQQQVQQIADQLYHQQRLQRQLSETILRTRLVPVQSIVSRMERTVRETCRQTEKKARITVHGQNLQVDTDILQGLSAPLLHMLRNAIDHGIEYAEERLVQGKPEEGHIELSFEQHGNQIHMTLRDDGQGLHTESIHNRAISRGIITPEQRLDEEEILNLILQPGFSTREQVSEVSGRGVGMDVVKSAVENLQGILHLKSTPGQGTSVHIQVPLTLIATHALLVRSGENLVAIPSNTIQQLTYVTADEHIQEDSKWYIPHQGQKLEVLALAQLLDWPSEAVDFTQGHSLLVVESEQQPYALYVDEIFKPRDIVVKSLNPWINISHGISGACMLADGAVAPVLDTLRLLRSFEQGQLRLKAGQSKRAKLHKEKNRILIVDDSLSNRKSLSLMIEQMGYQAITAVDGMEALQRLHEQKIELVLTDLEMPRMNGLEMTQAIRIWPEKLHLPVIMITSRSTQKHKNMAQQAGVDDYLTKPVDTQALKTLLKKWLSMQLAA